MSTLSNQIMHMTRSAMISSQLDALNQVSRILAEEPDLNTALHGALRAISHTTGMGRGMVSLIDPATGRLSVQATYEADDKAPPFTDGVTYFPGEGVVGSIVLSGDTFICEQPSQESRFVNRIGLLDPTLPFIGAPIPYEEGRYMGVLAAQPMFGNRAFLQEQAKFLETLASLISQKARSTLYCPQTQAAIAERNGQAPVRRIPGSEDLEPQKLIISQSRRMDPVYQAIKQAAKWDCTVLVHGESGTGKELVANAIHYSSRRSGAPFVSVNCAALSDNLLESELFGHEKGAFTGAANARKGRFELAHGGTLFLDEIGEISPAFQSKLLRVLQEGEFERVGGTRTMRVNVRIIAATNRDLYQRVQTGEFRADLFYRLFVMPIALPPLRERKEDIPLLTEKLLARIARKQGRNKLTLSDEALRRLCNNPWPGNVRELENCLERAAVMSDEGHIDAAHVFFPDLAGWNAGTISAPSAPLAPAPAATTPSSAPSGSGGIMDEDLDERERVLMALEQAGWVQAKAARLLGMTPRQVAYRIKILNIPMRSL
ncbi:nif-specific transcriptional activator NifA [Magnetofaba australis]|uniref:Nif-specific regulatory protein n=1 Tax=Magnetofaba australis IT-1 TaxID=1434232 RepID=A0A1Y2K2I9_9PROT|nr:nif-specific transcriptional activator NifA [Magnetofaba australis]OSM02223.1 putative NifA family transcriptional regulator [Magnetofaba australis IT-1]